MKSRALWHAAAIAMMTWPMPLLADDQASRPGQIGDSPYSVQGVSILVGLLVAVLTIIGFIRSWFSTNAKEAQEREDRLLATIEKNQDTFEDRLKTVEVTIRDFMPRSEIDRSVQHEKNNRVQVDEGQQRSIDKLNAETTETKIELGRLRERYDGIAADVGEIKSLVKEQGRDTAARLDKMGEAIATIVHAPR